MVLLFDWGVGCALKCSVCAHVETERMFKQLLHLTPKCIVDGVLLSVGCHGSRKSSVKSMVKPCMQFWAAHGDTAPQRTLCRQIATMDAKSRCENACSNCDLTV